MEQKIAALQEPIRTVQPSYPDLKQARGSSCNVPDVAETSVYLQVHSTLQPSFPSVYQSSPGHSTATVTENTKIPQQPDYNNYTMTNPLVQPEVCRFTKTK